jgi:hypothetical protein
MVMSLERELNELDRTKNRSKRGPLFESFLANLLEAQGFDVTINPKTAKPRQTDLCAQLEDLFFIIEAKWQRKPLHIGDVSAVHERLRTTPPGVFACVFSMSGYTGPARQHITATGALRCCSLARMKFAA